MLQAMLIWASAALAMFIASTVVTVAAAVSLGVSPKELVANPATSPLLSNPVWIAAGTAVNEIVVVTVLLVWVVVLKPTRDAVLPIRKPTSSAVFAALLVVFGLAPLADLVGRLVDRVVQSDVTAARIISEAARRASPLELALLLFCVAVLPAIIEEVMFRGVLTAAFVRHGAVVATLVPSVLFGVFHVEPTQVAATIVLGVGFGLARVYSGSLVPCVLAHGIYNAAVVMIVRYSDASPEDRSFSAIPLVLGALLVVSGVLLLRRSRASELSSPATAKTPLPPPA